MTACVRAHLYVHLGQGVRGHVGSVGWIPENADGLEKAQRVLALIHSRLQHNGLAGLGVVDELLESDARGPHPRARVRPLHLANRNQPPIEVGYPMLYLVDPQNAKHTASRRVWTTAECVRERCCLPRRLCNRRLHLAQLTCTSQATSMGVFIRCPVRSTCAIGITLCTNPPFWVILRAWERGAA